MIISSITDGISHGVGHCSIVFSPVDDENGEIEYNSIYVNWSDRAEPVIAELEFVASGMAQLADTVFILGRLGQIACIRDGVITQEEIQGPDIYGYLTEIKVIEKSIFALGMCRQVYTRNDNNIWVRFDSGVLDDEMQVDQVTGFRAMDGLSIKDFYAVGLEGEIWNYLNDNWRKIESPTNVTLEQVKAISPTDVYAVGQAGVVLYGSGDRWEQIDQTITEDDFWGLEWFNNAVYLSTATDIYRLNTKKELEKVAPVDTGPQYFSRLRASREVLWSLGPEKIYWTENGRTWREANIFSN